MRIHKYFRRRSHTPRLHSSSTSSFSSDSSSSSSSFSATTHGGNEGDGPVEGSNKTKKRPSWWKRQSFNSTTSKKSERKQKHDKPKRAKDTNHNSEKERYHNNHKEPFVSSSELDKALLYFEIQEDFNPTIVKKKYKKLCLIHHPDRNGNNEESIQEMQTINHYFDILQEELQKANNDPSVTRSSSSNSNNNSNSTNEKSKHSKRRSSHKKQRTSARRSQTRQTSDSTIHTRKKDPLGDLLLDVALSFLVGRFVMGTEWVTSALMIALVQFASDGNYKSSTRLSKSLLFTLHTGWFLLLECLATSQTLIGELPWQLKLVGLATVCSSFLEDHKDTPLKCLTNAILEMESALIGIFDWILSNNIIRCKNNNNIPIQTIADFSILSIAFLFGKLIYSALS